MGAGLRIELKSRIWLLSTIHGGILDPTQGVLMFFPHPPPLHGAPDPQRNHCSCTSSD